MSLFFFFKGFGGVLGELFSKSSPNVPPNVPLNVPLTPRKGESRRFERIRRRWLL